MTTTPHPADGPTDDAWAAALDATLADPGRVGHAVQPIVDLQRGVVVGHELLTRFPEPPRATPDRWFAAAERLGHGPALAAATVRAGVQRLVGLPPNTFLTINLEPGHAHDPLVRAAFAEAGRLDRLVVELTEHAAIDDVEAMQTEIAALRAVGARVAIDDAGAGHAGLAVLLELRPDLVKLDRALVTGLDRDPVRRVLVRALGELVDSIDGWVLAEGIETEAELEELVTLGVPLGQGYLLGRPAPEYTPEIDVALAAVIQRRLTIARMDDLVASQQERVPLITSDAAPSDIGPAVVVDDLGRPVAIDDGTGQRHHAPLLAKPSEPLAEVACRVAARPEGRVGEPVVVTDGQGRAVGILRVARLLDSLARRPSAP